MKEIQTYSNTANVNNNAAVKTIKEGDTFYYRVLQRLDNNKYLVNILGKKITATINEKIADSGLVRVVKVDKELVLKIVKDSDIKENTLNNQMIMHNKYKNILLDNGVKASYTNINYLETMLKYLDNITTNEKNLLLNYISKGQYFSVNELESIFGENVYIILRKYALFSKISKTKILHSDNYKTLVNEFINNANHAEVIKSAVDNNGHIAFLLFLLDSLSDEEINTKLKLVIKSLSANRRSKSPKKNVYYLSVPVSMNDKTEYLKLFIEREDKAKLKMCFVFFDNNREFFKIDIEKTQEGYNFLVSIFDKVVYDKYIKNESYLLSEIDAIKKRTNIKIDVGVAYES